MADLDLDGPAAPSLSPDGPDLTPSGAPAPTGLPTGEQRLAELDALVDAGGDGAPAHLVGPAREALVGVRLAQSQDPVAEATGTVRDALTTGWTDPAISRNDLDTIRDTFSALSRDEATAVAGNLTDAELSTWAGDVLGAQVPVIGGYGVEAREQLYSMLADRLDADQLRRVVEAFGEIGSTAEDRRIGLVVAEHAPEAVRVELVRDVALDVDASRDQRFVAGETLASLTGDAFDRAVEGLPNDRLRDVIGTTMEETGHASVGPMGHGTYTVSYDAQTMGRVLSRVAEEGDARVRAVAFDVGGDWLETLGQGGSWLTPEIGRRGSVATLREGLATILEEDPAGTVAYLAERVDTRGGALATTVGALVANGEQERVGTILGNVATGNGQASSAAWFLQVETDQNGVRAYPNAATLGYAAGAVYAGIDGLGQSVRERGQTVKDVFGTAAGVGGPLSAPVAIGGAVLMPITSRAVDAVVASEIRAQRNLGDALVDLTFPRDPNGNIGAVPPAARTAFDAALGATYVQSRP